MAERRPVAGFDWSRSRSVRNSSPSCGDWRYPCWRRRDCNKIVYANYFGEHVNACLFDNEQRGEVPKLLILNELIPTIIKNQPFAFVKDCQHRVILADDVVMHQQHTQALIRNARFTKRCVLGEYKILAVARLLVQRSPFTDG